jgi:alpha-beta hydrolase superfamily lysophospholipase
MPDRNPSRSLHPEVFVLKKAAPPHGVDQVARSLLWWPARSKQTPWTKASLLKARQHQLLICLKALSVCVFSFILFANPGNSQSPGVQRFKGIDLTVPAKINGRGGLCNLGVSVTLPYERRANAVVLFLHGSGPIDRNGTVPGGTAIYRDLAITLAEAGIASVRFDKRTVYTDCATRIDETFLPKDVFDDIITVHNATMALPDLAGLPLYVFGHSEGATFAIEMIALGMLAPKGLILVGGLGRFPINATVMSQLKQHTAAQTDLAAKKQAAATTAKAEDFFARLQKGTVRSQEALLGAYSAYWKSLQDITVRTASSAAKITAPVLVLHGDADKQVTKEDYEALRGFFGSAKSTSSRLFANMTHLLTEGAESVVSKTFSSEVITWLEKDVSTLGKPIPNSGTKK